MAGNELFEKYKETQCVNCKNRKSDLCEIRINVTENLVCARCVYFERDKEIEKPQKALFRTAKQGKPRMKLL